MRARRERLGLTVRELAVRSGLRESSASYISQLESGAKTPHEPLALRLAEALEDDPRLYAAWAALGRRSDPIETARAVRLLAELLDHPAFAWTREPALRNEPATGTRPIAPDPRSSSPDSADRSAREAPEAPRPPESVRPLPAPADRGGLPPPLAVAQRDGDAVLVPEYEEGADPGDPTRPAPRELATHRVSPGSCPLAEPLARPFAYRLSEAGVRRVRDALAPGEIAVLTRRIWPLEPSAPHAVRLSGHVVLSRVLWNERQLLLLPAPGESDFLVLEAPGRTALERLVAGRVAAVLRPEA
ncbi:MAG TPA: helix-turn-helix domain-containing protein [Terriglobales bacterium]|nr:helix-turn-helix domain-containing protein [Terriglobales bacterium]